MEDEDSVNSLIQDAKNSMSRKELLFINLPLVILLIGVIVYEIRTGLIFDLVVLPAALFFLVGSIVFGSRPWWHYPLGMVSLLLIMVLFAMVLESLFSVPMVGGGVIKLLAATGAALGLILSLEVVGLFICIMCIALLVSKYAFNMGTMPSSPFILISILCVFIRNYGFRFFASNGYKSEKPSEFIETSAILNPPSLPKPNEAELIRKAGILFKAGNFTNAIDALTQVLENNNTSDTAFYNRGIVFFKMGKKEKAIFDFKAAAKLGHRKAKELLNRHENAV